MAQGTAAAKATAEKDTTATTTDTGTSATSAAGPEVVAPPAAGTEGGTSDGNTAVPGTGDHDRVAMLSLRADGTPDQTERVEMIGDPETSKAATVEQFRQQAVSAEDVRLRGVTSASGAETVEQDPTIQALVDAHDKVAEQATKAAESAVDALHTGESAQIPESNPASPDAGSSS